MKPHQLYYETLMSNDVFLLMVSIYAFAENGIYDTVKSESNRAGKKRS